MGTFDDIQAEADTRRATSGHGQSTPDDWSVSVAKLALLHPIEFDRVAKSEAKRLGCKVSTLEDAVKRARGGEHEDRGRGRPLEKVQLEPWPHPVAGEDIAEEIAATVARFVALPEHAAVAAALWALHTHAFEASTITPRLNIASPVKRCGKTLLLEIIGALAARPIMCGSISASAIFRVVEAVRPTLLIDEADTFFERREFGGAAGHPE